MNFSDSFLQELTDRNDIVDVVGSYVRLSKKSGSNMFGLCPFHNEKTPSFSVSPSRQIYHCFGCGKGGGVINFIMEIENLSYPDAVEFLAKRVNLPMPERRDSAESRKKKRLYEINRDAARFFHDKLYSPDGAPGIEYLQKRRIGKATATNFGLGYAPDSWDSLLKALRAKGYTDNELFDAGLVRRGKNGGFYDYFRSRLMFPVIDVRGNVIGFSGRIITTEPNPPAKYMNSPDTPVYNKSRSLFALNLAKKSKSGYIILTEGNIDVVSMHQAGFDSAVASLGTSFTPEQARLISNYTSQVIIAYDNDSAGIKAAQRAIGILEKLDVKVKVLRLSGAKDADEFIKLKGAEAFRLLLEASEDQIDYRLNSVTAKYDLSIDEQKVGFLKEATELVARLPGMVERQVYSMRVATMAGLQAEVVSSEVERRRKTILKKADREQERVEARPERQFQPTEKNLRYSDPASAAAEEGIIRLLYLEPGLIRLDGLPKSEEFSSPELGKIYKAICERLQENSGVSVNILSEVLTQEEASLLVKLLQKPEQLSQSNRAMRDYINRIRDCRSKKNEENDLRALANKLRQNGKGYEV